MIKLNIINITGNNYLLEDINKRKYNVYMTFENIKENIEINDCIYLNENIINEKNIYTFGPILNGNIDNVDLLCIEKNNKKIYLQRYYG